MEPILLEPDDFPTGDPGGLSPSLFGGSRQPLQMFEPNLGVSVPQQMASAAIEARSRIFNDALSRVYMTLSQVMWMKQMYAHMGMPPSFEQWLFQYTQHYLTDVGRLTEAATEKIMTELRSYDPLLSSEEPEDFLTRLVYLFTGKKETSQWSW